MTRFGLLVILALAAVCHTLAAPDVSNRWIIRLKPEAQQAAFTAKLEDIIETANARSDKSVEHWLENTYSIGSFKAYSVHFPGTSIRRLAKDSMVDSITPDDIVYALGTEQNPPSWGLRRISERALNLTQPYTYPDTAGAGVTAYVIDTGMMITHPDINGRATWGFTACSGCQNMDDNGHGTHVATTIGGTIYGVAKKVNLVAVKVLDGSGSGTISGVLSGINWVAQRAANSSTPSVANMSLGGRKNQQLNDAVTAAINAGVVFGVAAGNDGGDACNGSPSSTPQAITVGASTSTDARAWFSDFGSCVTMFAPGVDITAGWNDGKSKTISGTSMATPHVVGVAALFLSQNPSLPAAQVKGQMQIAATPGVVTDVQGSPNLLVFNTAASAIKPTQ
ncbi:hypothetical protein RI367_001300 [Sorochytrium milnesiophthora]